MADELIVNTVSTAATHVYGRTLNSTRNHHFVIDGTRDPKEELTPVEVFVSSISSCCVHWVEQLAREAGANLDAVTVEITAIRRAQEPTRFDSIELVVRGSGPSQQELERFVEGYRARCPIYRTVAQAAEVGFTVLADEVGS